MRQIKTHPADAVCVLCGDAVDLGDVAYFVNSHTKGIDNLCVCDDCLDKLVTVENVMKFAAQPGCACDSDEERFKDSVWSALYTYDDIIELCRRDFEERKESPVEWDRREIRTRLKEYVNRYDTEDFVECVEPSYETEIANTIEDIKG